MKTQLYAACQEIIPLQETRDRNWEDPNNGQEDCLQNQNHYNRSYIPEQIAMLLSWKLVIFIEFSGEKTSWVKSRARKIGKSYEFPFSWVQGSSHRHDNS